MLIRGQRKYAFVNLKEIDTICIESSTYERRECFAIKYYCGNRDTKGTLAKYSTSEKALKVLDMICEHYQNCEMCRCGLKQIAETEFVFQMPQDDEV